MGRKCGGLCVWAEGKWGGGEGVLYANLTCCHGVSDSQLSLTLRHWHKNKKKSADWTGLHQAWRAAGAGITQTPELSVLNRHLLHDALHDRVLK